MSIAMTVLALMALVVTVVFGGLGIRLLLAKLAEHQARLDAQWQQVADAHGMVYANGTWEQRNLHGTMYGLPVVLRHELISTGQVTYTRTLCELTGLPTGLVLRPERSVMGTLNRLAGTDHQVGDPDFDAQMQVGGDPVETLAWLDAPTRALLSRVLGPKVSLGKGKLLQAHDDQINDPEKLTALLALASQVAEKLSGSRELAPRLAHNALHDPLPGVRLANLRALVEHGPEALVRDVATQALDDADLRMVTVAREALGLQAPGEVEGAVSLARLGAEEGALSEVRRTGRADQQTDRGPR